MASDPHTNGKPLTESTRKQLHDTKIDKETWHEAVNQPSVVTAISKQEKEKLSHLVSLMDRDGDGKLSLGELLQVRAHRDINR